MNAKCTAHFAERAVKVPVEDSTLIAIDADTFEKFAARDPLSTQAGSELGTRVESADLSSEKPANFSTE
jgi:hypothetical protein